MTDFETIVVDHPSPGVARITLDRADKRNAISTRMRTEILAVLEAHDLDDAVRVTILRGSGACFSAGYDLAGDLMAEPPFHTAPGDGVGRHPGHHRTAVGGEGVGGLGGTGLDEQERQQREDPCEPSDWIHGVLAFARAFQRRCISAGGTGSFSWKSIHSCPNGSRMRPHRWP